MATGLMSCVRENSPPLELTDPDGSRSLPPDTLEPQKRRRFHPLRNLRRIFRRRTVTHTDNVTNAHTPNSPDSNLSADVTHSASINALRGSGAAIGNNSSGGGGIVGGFYAKEKRDNSAESVRKKDINEELDREMIDCQRSLSEGRLVDSEYNRDPLSQSHDSVFSESATASSLSIVLKAELVDVLRKRRNRPDASDEDLGLPRSPTTPQRKDRIINHSEGSLSLLSMASSDMDDESSSFGGHNSTVSSKMSQDMSRYSDETDLNLSVGSRLSHSAAHHKMAIRPKKKGPTRHRRPIENSVLPSTPEVNEDIHRMSSLDITDFSSIKLKSQSLPPGVNAKILESHSTVTTTINKETSSVTVSNITDTVSSSIYVNRNISKSYDFEKDSSNSASSTLDRKDDEGFFKRLLHRNSKKKKSIEEKDTFDAKALFENVEHKRIDSKGDYVQQGPEISIPPDVVKTVHKEELKENVKLIKEEIKREVKEMRREGIVIETKPYESMSMSSSTSSYSFTESERMDLDRKGRQPRSGPASRQRVIPQDLSVSPEMSNRRKASEMNEKEKLPPKSPKISSDSSRIEGKPTTAFRGTQEYKERLFTKASQHRSEEQLIPKLRKLSNEDISHSMSPPKSIWPENLQHREMPVLQQEYKLKSAKIYGLSSFQQRVSNIDIQEEELLPRRKSVEKSKSFRIYSENTNDNLQNSNNLPSLPDLSNPNKYDDAEPKFLSMTEEYGRQRRPSKDRIIQDNSSALKFEINDNNLVKPKEEHHYQFDQQLTNHGMYTKNIILTTSKTANSQIMSSHTSVSNQNISQIEENIDKLVKSSFVTVLKKSATSTEMVEAKTRTAVTSNISVTSIGGGVDTPAMDIATTPSVEEIKMEEEPVLLREKSLDRDSNGITTPKSRRTSAVYEKSSEPEVPEFMKIQLNRVDSTRPKSHVVLSKNAKEVETNRRFSNENMTADTTDTKPPLPPDTAASKRNSLTKSQELVNDLPKSPVRKTIENRKVSVGSPIVEVPLEKNIDISVDQKSMITPERRKSVSDEKAKIERRISVNEEVKVERKKSTDESKMNLSNEVLRKSSSDDENGVVLRKKSVVSTSNSKEDTPELMKVFARRSLKIKDSEELQLFEEIEKANIFKAGKSINLDSDKENQSSSEEKLDRLPKLDIPINNNINNNNNNIISANVNQLNNKTTINGSAVIVSKEKDDKNRDAPKKLNDTTNGDGYRKNSIITPKPFVTPSRFGNVSNYRNTTTFLDVRKNLLQQQPTAIAVTTPVSEQSQANVNNNNISNNNLNNFNNNGNNVRHTISAATIAQAEDDDNNVEKSEFKGILQRRAEWEKRAKEAFK